MKISALQFDIKWCEIEHNHNVIEQYIENDFKDSDIIILPEMFSTGFSMNPSKIAQTMNGATVTWMKKCAIKYKKAIVGTIAIKELDNNEEIFYVNRLIFAKDDGGVEYSDKRHLFRLSGEDKVYNSGDNRKIIEYKGVRFLPLVCYDLRFPIWSRLIDCDYDVILYVASWPEPRVFVWSILLQARAIENQAYVIGVNRVGDDKENHYNGKSVILNYLGDAIASAQDNINSGITAEISMEKLAKARAKFPVCLDADKFNIEI